MTQAQAKLLLEITELPQLTVTLPKALEAGAMHAAIKGIVEEFNKEEIASNTAAFAAIDAEHAANADASNDNHET